MTLNRKVLKTISLYVFVGLVALVAFLYVRFPSALLRDYFIAGLAAGYPDLSLSLGDVNPRFPPGLSLERVVLQSKTHTDASLQADSLIIRPVLTSLMKEQTSWNLNARGYGGRMEGAVGVSEDQLRRAAHSAVCKINIDSDGRLAMTAAIRKVLGEKPSEFDPRKYLGPAREELVRLIKHKNEAVLGSAGHGREIMAAITG